MRVPTGLLVATAALLLLVPAGSPRPGASTAQQGAAAERAAPARHVDRALLMSDVTTLAAPAFEGRRTGTPGGLRAREWIVDQFSRIGLLPAAGRTYLQPFTVREARGASAANVIGRAPGREPHATVIVVTAHYDHFGIRDGVRYPGADDNASGVAVLLGAARHFIKDPPRHSILFAALDAEELGLHGARALVRSDLLPRGRVALNVNLDMLSRNDANEIYAAGTYYSPWQITILRDVQTRATVQILFGHDRPAATGDSRDDWTQLSDHGAFHAAGIPFVYFGVEDHPDYHKPTDTSDRIDPRFFGDVADMVVEAIRTFDARLP